MTKKNKEQITWTTIMTDRRQNDRRTVDTRRKMSGENMVLMVPDVRSSERRSDERRKVKLTITGRAVEVGSKNKKK